MKAHQKYQLLKRKQEEIGWPRLYTDDLHVRDREALSQRNPAFFVWLVYEIGTWLILPDHPRGLVVLYWMLENPGMPLTRAFVFDKGMLVEATLDRGLWDLLLARAKSPAIRRFADLCPDDPCFWHRVVAGAYAAQVDKELRQSGWTEAV